MDIKKINIQDYNYLLPEEKIAKYPLPERTSSKLLIYDKGKIKSDFFYHLPDFLSPGDRLIFNATKVIQARLLFQETTGAKIEIFCLEPEVPADYEQIFQTTKNCTWKCIVGNSKKWKSGKLSLELIIEGKKLTLFAERTFAGKDFQLVKFFWDNPTITFAEILEKSGKTPIPPYLRRESEESDTIRYQTVYSKQKGSVAAPTAGLHFSKGLIKTLKEKNIGISELILHVGAGTFKPVKNDTVADHDMHTEHFIVSKELIKTLLENLGNIVAVGTTSVRTLESLYRIGLKLKDTAKPEAFHVSQWEAYKSADELSVQSALQNILNYMDANKLNCIEATTKIIIVPGYTFKIVNKLITNFHQPKSTLLLLVSAFIGKDREKVYDYALKNDFRFLSYGDSSLLIPSST